MLIENLDVSIDKHCLTKQFHRDLSQIIEEIVKSENQKQEIAIQIAWN